MEQAIKEIVDRHFTNILIDMAKDYRIPFDGDVTPPESITLEEVQEDLTNGMLNFFEKWR